MFNLRQSKWLGIDSVLLHGCIYGTIVRCTIIAGKYATYPEKQVKKVKEVVLSEREISAEHMLAAWHAQMKEIRYAELTNAIERYEIDRGTLQINFFS